jgi:hypothetical protein
MGSTEKTHPGRSARAGGDAALVWAYCWSHVLPIWEQWTSGDLVMRRALEATANPEVAGDSALSDLIDAAFMLFHTPKQPNCAAPLYAAIAVIYSIQGYPVDDVVEFGLQAIAQHALAEEQLAARDRQA